MSFLLGYIDPAATSVLLSSITAIVVAISASAIILWRKFKKKINKTLKIDPNKGKEVEEDIVVSDETVKEETKEASTEQETTKDE
ncbi:MAG: hypothetical protein IKA31_01405 [Clostridia bacterium]|nr:hypothetical protein [Clostridia bacterium]